MKTDSQEECERVAWCCPMKLVSAKVTRTEAQLPENSLICSSNPSTLFSLPLLNDVPSSVSTWLGLLTLVLSRLPARLPVLSDSTGNANCRPGEMDASSGTLSFLSCSVGQRNTKYRVHSVSRRSRIRIHLTAGE